MRLGARLLGLVTVVTLLFTGCSSTLGEELDASFSGIAGVKTVYIEEHRVKATLADGVAAADAEAAIVTLRDRAVAEHPLGADVELVVVLNAGPRDLGGPQPWQVYSYASWSEGALAGDGFAQQAAFFARLAEWESLLTTPAQIRRVLFAVTGVDSPVETLVEGEEGATDEGAAEEAVTDGEVADAGDGADVVEPTVQTRVLRLDQVPVAGNSADDIRALLAELTALWTETGGLPEELDAA